MKLYHYTTIDSLAMIMSSRSIKFNRLDKVDDLEERTDSQNVRWWYKRDGEIISPRVELLKEFQSGSVEPSP